MVCGYYSDIVDLQFLCIMPLDSADQFGRTNQGHARVLLWLEVFCTGEVDDERDQVVDNKVEHCCSHDNSIEAEAVLETHY